MTEKKAPRERASAEQIIASYLECKSIKKVCEDLHAGSQRVERVLHEAGIKREKKVYQRHVQLSKEMPKEYALAIIDYQAGVTMPVLKKQYGVSYAQLYRWMNRVGVNVRKPHKAPPIKKWWCWECGVETPRQHWFCCEAHRREYRDGAGPNTELGAIYCLHCDKPLPYNLKRFCDNECNRAYYADRKQQRPPPKTNRKNPNNAQAQDQAA